MFIKDRLQSKEAKKRITDFGRKIGPEISKFITQLDKDGLIEKGTGTRPQDKSWEENWILYIVAEECKEASKKGLNSRFIS